MTFVAIFENSNELKFQPIKFWQGLLHKWTLGADQLNLWMLNGKGFAVIIRTIL